MNWDDYGTACRARGCLAMEVFACITSPAKEGPPAPELLAAHLAYQKDLEARGVLFLAGPLSDPSGAQMSGAGLIIYRAADIAAARQLAEADPMHASGQRTFTLQAWRLNEGAPIQGLRLSERSFDRL
ncbi:YciI family protein [Pararhodobacter oceanensis]|uniref:YciI family protein n=1 Tax=Pararhodobacter oceanensis TaxID=2172121 RepID=UPI003A8F99FF